MDNETLEYILEVYSLDELVSLNDLDPVEVLKVILENFEFNLPYFQPLS